MATRFDTGNKAPAEDFCPQPAPAASLPEHELLLIAMETIKTLNTENHRLNEENTRLNSENKRLSSENSLLRNQIILFKTRDGKLRADICDAVWAKFCRYLDQDREQEIRSEIINTQAAWWYMQYDFLCIRGGHIKDLVKFLHKYMNQAHKRLFNIDSEKQRNDLRDYIIKNIGLYTSGELKELDRDSLRHPIKDIFAP